MIEESRLVRDTILGHLRGPLLTAPGQQVAASFTADLPGRKGAVVMPAPVPQPRYALWGTAFGSTGNSDADGNAASLNRRSGGALLGADVMLYDAPGSSLKVGVAGGYSQSRFDLDARLSSAGSRAAMPRSMPGPASAICASMPVRLTPGRRATSAARSRSAASATCCGCSARAR
jgi:uncharacterized protein with beta-barrel porin domain